MSIKIKLKTFWLLLCQYFRLTGTQIISPFTHRGSLMPTARLYARKLCADGTIVDLGLLGTKVVTDAFVAYLVDGLQSSATDVALFKYHDCGTGVTAEDAGDTALVTPYGGARTSGTQTEGASANIYKSVGTISFTSTLAIVEHGLFSASSAGTLMDRTKFTSIGVDNGDSIEFTYELTCPAGS